MADEKVMGTPGMLEIFLIGLGGVVMTYILLSAIGQSACSAASVLIDDRRKNEERRRLEDEAAEMAGRAAAIEPLALNPDGTIEEPIVAMVEGAA